MLEQNNFGQMLLRNKSEGAGRVGEERGKANKVCIPGMVNLWTAGLQLFPRGPSEALCRIKLRLSLIRRLELLGSLYDKSDYCQVLRSRILPGALPK